MTSPEKDSFVYVDSYAGSNDEEESEGYAVCYWDSDPVVLVHKQKFIAAKAIKPKVGIIVCMKYYCKTKRGPVARLDESIVLEHSSFTQNEHVVQFEDGSVIHVTLTDKTIANLQKFAQHRNSVQQLLTRDPRTEQGETAPGWLLADDFCMRFWQRTQIPCPVLWSVKHENMMDRHVFYYSMHENMNTDFSESELLYFDNACLFFLALYGVTQQEFVDDPMQYTFVLGQVMALHAWSVPYSLDVNRKTGQPIEQTWPLLLNPLENRRTGDCEDSAHDIAYNFRRFKQMRTKNHKSRLVQALLAIAENYSCCLIEGVLKIQATKVYHVYAVLLSLEDIKSRTGLKLNGTRALLPPIWLEPTHLNDPKLDRPVDENQMKQFFTHIGGLPKELQKEVRVPFRFAEKYIQSGKLYGHVIRVYNYDLFREFSVLCSVPNDAITGVDFISKRTTWSLCKNDTSAIRNQIKVYDSILPPFRNLSISKLSNLEGIPEEGCDSMFYFVSEHEQHKVSQFKNVKELQFNVTDNIKIFVYFRK